MWARTASGRCASSRAQAGEVEAPPLAPRAGAEELDAAVVGQRAVDGAVGEHDDLVDPCRERAQLADDRAEVRVLGIDDLGGEDDPRHRKSRSPSSKCGRSGRPCPGSSALPSTLKLRWVGT